jgi:hypothetical protein
MPLSFAHGHKSFDPVNRSGGTRQTRAIGQPVRTSVTMKMATLVLVAICFARSATADDVQTLGAGARATCGKWLADRQSGNAFPLTNWALGFLSGGAVFSENLNPLEPPQRIRAYGRPAGRGGGVHRLRHHRRRRAAELEGAAATRKPQRDANGGDHRARPDARGRSPVRQTPGPSRAVRATRTGVAPRFIRWPIPRAIWLKTRFAFPGRRHRGTVIPRAGLGAIFSGAEP